MSNKTEVDTSYLRKIHKRLRDCLRHLSEVSCHAGDSGDMELYEGCMHLNDTADLVKRVAYPKGRIADNTITVRIENIRDMEQRLLNVTEWVKKGRDYIKKGRHDMVSESNNNQALIHLRYLGESLKYILDESGLKPKPLENEEVSID